MITPMSDSAQVQKILARYKQLKADRQPWVNNWQLIGEYVMTRKQNFNTALTPGQFITEQVFDSTAPQANHEAASGLLALLWPNAGDKFYVEAPDNMDPEVAKSDRIRKFYERMDKVVNRVMNNPKGGLPNALEEHMHDSTSFGTSGVGAYQGEDKSVPVVYKAIDCKRSVIAEGANGFVDTVYTERVMTVRQLVQEYTIDNISEKSRGLYKSGDMERKVKVLRCVEPRMEYTHGTFGNRDYPVASIHIEMDAAHKLKESGYHQMPDNIVRFYKSMDEIYGRSLAYETMSQIITVNALEEAYLVATEKQLDPPLLVSDDGSLGGGDINTSAGAVTVRRLSGRAGDVNHRSVEQLVTIGEMKTTHDKIVDIRERIKAGFLIDKLQDLNNDSRMTAFETDIRNKMRGNALGIIFARQIMELFDPLIERTVNILLLAGLLGKPAENDEVKAELEAGKNPFVMPPEVFDLAVAGEEYFKITYKTPAIRLMSAEALAAVQRVMQTVAESAAVVPNIVDNIDTDECIQLIAELSGAPPEIVNGLDTVKKLRASKAAAQKQMQDLQMKQAEADIAKAAGQAAHSAVKAGIDPSQLAQVASG